LSSFWHIFLFKIFYGFLLKLRTFSLHAYIFSKETNHIWLTKSLWNSTEAWNNKKKNSGNIKSWRVQNTVKFWFTIDTIFFVFPLSNVNRIVELFVFGGEPELFHVCARFCFNLLMCLNLFVNPFILSVFVACFLRLQKKVEAVKIKIKVESRGMNQRHFLKWHFSSGFHHLDEKFSKK